MEREQNLLVINERPPMSYSPSGERIFHMAQASRFTFDRVIVLSLYGTRGQSRKRGSNLGKSSRVFHCAVNFRRAMPYPVLAFFDLIKFVVLLTNGIVLARRYPPALVIASLPPFENGLCAFVLTKLFRASLVIDLRDDWESAISAQLRSYVPAIMINILTKSASVIYSSAQAILAATQTVADNIRYRGVKTPIFLVPNGADTKAFIPVSDSLRTKIRSNFGLPPNKLIVVYCGSGISPYYRLDVVLSSIRVVSSGMSEPFFFVFYVYNGSGYLEKLKHQLGLQDSLIEIRNPLPRNELAEVLAACDIGLVPFDGKDYLKCARSTKLYEYLSSGLFVLCSGPKGGELDSFFSENPSFGLFTLPNAPNFALLLERIAKRDGDIYDDAHREARYEFIRSKYDRRSIMAQAVDLFYAKD